MPTPDDFAAAVARHRAGDLDGAEAGYRRILRGEPGHADSLHLLGVVEHQRGRHEEAVESIGRAIALDPRRAPYRNNLGIALKALGRLDEAVAAYIEALRIDPAYADARSNLGVALQHLGQPDRARVSFEAALRLAPDHPDALFNLANLLREGGDAPGAIAAYRRSLRLAPGRFDALANLGQALLDCGRAEEAVEYFRMAAPLDPAATGHGAATLGPAPPADPWAIRIAAACPAIFPDVAAIDRYRDGLEAALDAHPHGVRLPPGGAASSGCHAPSFQLAHQGRDDRALKAKFAAAFARNFHDLHARPGDGPPRIGFVANDPHEGGFLRCTGGIADRLDSGRFRVVIFGTARAMPALRAGILRPDAEFVAIPATLPEAAEAIAAARCDVLYHWQVGTDPLNYFLPFARPAPVQCTSWGTHGTSGIPAMDYYLSAGSIEAPEADAHYTAQQIERLTEAYLSGVVSLVEYQRRRKELERRDATLATQEESLSGEASRAKEISGLRNCARSFAERVRVGLDTATFERRRQLVELLIDRVVVTGDDVEIRYAFPIGPAGETGRFCHLRLDYLGAPDLIPPPDLHAPEQVRVDPVALPGQAQPGLGVDRLQAHDSHQPPDPLAVHLLPSFVQPDRHPPAAAEGAGGVLLVDPPHQPQVLGRLPAGLVVEARPAQPQQLALPTHAQGGVAVLDQSPLVLT